MSHDEKYEAPAVKVLGTVADLTAGQNLLNSDGGGLNSADPNPS
jgi:hypothetical protein